MVQGRVIGCMGRWLAPGGCNCKYCLGAPFEKPEPKKEDKK